jgi:hypothetical protein
LVVFQVKGTVNKSSVTTDSLKAMLKAQFSKQLDPQTIASISTAIGFGYVSNLETNFNTQIDNIYVQSFLTARLVDKIELQKLQQLTQ